MTRYRSLEHLVRVEVFLGPVKMQTFHNILAAPAFERQNVRHLLLVKLQEVERKLIKFSAHLVHLGLHLVNVLSSVV